MYVLKKKESGASPLVSGTIAANEEFVTVTANDVREVETHRKARYVASE